MTVVVLRLNYGVVLYYGRHVHVHACTVRPAGDLTVKFKVTVMITKFKCTCLQCQVALQAAKFKFNLQLALQLIHLYCNSIAS